MATHFVDDRTVALPAETRAAPRRFLFNPVVDFFTFGGASLVIFAVLLLLDAQAWKAGVAATFFMLSHLINNPHFANSYQIFYRGFAAKAFRGSAGREMQIRYLVAGLAVPVLLVAFFTYAIVSSDLRLLGWGANAMALFVGWHYVKQGYGLMMVDCALKKQFFSEADKKVFLVNSYVVWAASWAYFNRVVATNKFFGIEYYAFGLPKQLVWLALLIAGATTIATVGVLLRNLRAKGTLPWNGVMAYTVSLYTWLAFIRVNILWALITPALHSIQYLAVVWRFETNYAAAWSRENGKLDDATGKPRRSAMVRHLAVFGLAGLMLGAFGFWVGPAIMMIAFEEPQKILGVGVFVFAWQIFVNVHHYFMDNVMWRRNNPDAKAYLFG